MCSARLKPVLPNTQELGGEPHFCCFGVVYPALLGWLGQIFFLANVPIPANRRKSPTSGKTQKLTADQH
jgi:hypothetical protein